jgi:hypothetical protein
MSASSRSVACALLLAAGASAAQEDSAPWSLTWRAPAQCIQPGELAQRVETQLKRTLFGLRGDRHIEGTASRQDDGLWIAKVTVNDSDGRVIGSREILSRDLDCRSLDSPLGLALAILIEPALGQPSAPPPPPEAVKPILRAPAPRELLRRDGPERFFLGAREIERPELYTLVGRPDLRQELLNASLARVVKRIAGGFALATGGLLFLGYATGAACVRYGGTPSSPGACLEGSPVLLTSAIAFSALGVVLFGWSAVSVVPTTPDQDARLIDGYNAR